MEIKVFNKDVVKSICLDLELTNQECHELAKSIRFCEQALMKYSIGLGPELTKILKTLEKELCMTK